LNNTLSIQLLLTTQKVYHQLKHLSIIKAHIILKDIYKANK